VALKLLGLGVELKQAVDGFGLVARGFGQALGRAPGGGAEDDPPALAGVDSHDPPDQRRLVRSGAAGDDEHLLVQRGPDGLLLEGSQSDPVLLLVPRDRAACVHRQGPHWALQQAPHGHGDPAFSLVERREEDAGMPAHVLSHQLVGAKQEGELAGHRLRGDICARSGREGLRGCVDQCVVLAADVPVLGQAVEGVHEAGGQPRRGVRRDAQLRAETVCGEEPDAPDLVGQPVGVLADDLHRLPPVALIDPGGERGRHAVALEADHDVPDRPLLGPGRLEPGRTHGARSRRPP